MLFLLVVALSHVIPAATPTMPPTAEGRARRQEVRRVVLALVAVMLMFFTGVLFIIFQDVNIIVFGSLVAAILYITGISLISR